jgi:uncharacterized protein YjgD (DUF1641 family)
MAQPISLKLAPRDPKQELLARLEQAPAEHAAALLDSYELLQELHEHGVFTLVRGALGATDKLVEAATAGANSEESIRAIRNAMILAKMLGSIDPEFLQGISNAVGETLGNAKRIPEKPPGLFSLLIGFTSSDHRRGLALVERLFGKIGKHMGSPKGSSKHS